jgi:spore coat protein U-like protein
MSTPKRSCANRMLTLLVASAVLATGSVAPARAQQSPPQANEAVLPVEVGVFPNCDVLSQPQQLDVAYDTITNQSTQGTSSFTYACTLGAPVAILINDAGSGGGSGSGGGPCPSCVLRTQPPPPPDAKLQGPSGPIGPPGPSGPGGPGNFDFVAHDGQTALNYWLFNNLTCTSPVQLSPYGIEKLGLGTGTPQTYDICGQVDTSNGGQNVPSGAYSDTVTFIFNWLG